jgi:hypothetical protein
MASLNEIEHAFKSHCAELGVIFTGSLIPDGTLHRAHVEGAMGSLRDGFSTLAPERLPLGRYPVNANRCRRQ